MQGSLITSGLNSHCCAGIRPQIPRVQNLESQTPKHPVHTTVSSLDGDRPDSPSPQFFK
jgi:hypothetical protein